MSPRTAGYARGALPEGRERFAKVGPMAFQPKLIIELPRGSAVDRQLASETLPSIASGDVVVEVGPTDADGQLEAQVAGQVVLSLLSPEALERESGQVRRVIAHAGTGIEP